MSHSINSSNGHRPRAMFADTAADNSAAKWQPPGQAKKHHLSDVSQHASKTPESADTSHGSPADASLIGWLKNKLGPMLAAVQQRDAQQPGAPAQTEENIKQKVAVAAAILVSDNQLWTQHKHLDTAALKDIIAHSKQHPATTVQAAQTMLDNPTYFAQAGHHHKHGHAEGEVRRQDLIKLAKSLVNETMIGKHAPDDPAEVARYREAALAAVAARAVQQAATPVVNNDAEVAQAASARRVLQADTSLWDDKKKLSLHDLQHVLKHPDQYAPPTVNASLYMLQHPAAFADPAMTATAPKA